jgi:hypothetical protein
MTRFSVARLLHISRSNLLCTTPPELSELDSYAARTPRRPR